MAAQVIQADFENKSLLSRQANNKTQTSVIGLYRGRNHVNPALLTPDMVRSVQKQTAMFNAVNSEQIHLTFNLRAHRLHKGLEDVEIRAFTKKLETEPERKSNYIFVLNARHIPGASSQNIKTEFTLRNTLRDKRPEEILKSTNFYQDILPAIRSKLALS